MRCEITDELRNFVLFILSEAKPGKSIELAKSIKEIFRISGPFPLEEIDFTKYKHLAVNINFSDCLFFQCNLHGVETKPPIPLNHMDTATKESLRTPLKIREEDPDEWNSKAADLTKKIKKIETFYHSPDKFLSMEALMDPENEYVSVDKNTIYAVFEQPRLRNRPVNDSSYGWKLHINVSRKNESVRVVSLLANFFIKLDLQFKFYDSRNDFDCDDEELMSEKIKGRQNCQLTVYLYRNNMPVINEKQLKTLLDEIDRTLGEAGIQPGEKQTADAQTQSSYVSIRHDFLSKPFCMLLQALDTGIREEFYELESDKRSAILRKRIPTPPTYRTEEYLESNIVKGNFNPLHMPCLYANLLDLEGQTQLGAFNLSTHFSRFNPKNLHELNSAFHFTLLAFLNNKLHIEVSSSEDLKHLLYAGIYSLKDQLKEFLKLDECEEHVLRKIQHALIFIHLFRDGGAEKRAIFYSFQDELKEMLEKFDQHLDALEESASLNETDNFSAFGEIELMQRIVKLFNFITSLTVEVEIEKGLNIYDDDYAETIYERYIKKFIELATDQEQNILLGFTISQEAVKAATHSNSHKYLPLLIEHQEKPLVAWLICNLFEFVDKENDISDSVEFIKILKGLMDFPASKGACLLFEGTQLMEELVASIEKIIYSILKFDQEQLASWITPMLEESNVVAIALLASPTSQIRDIHHSLTQNELVLQEGVPGAFEAGVAPPAKNPDEQVSAVVIPGIFLSPNANECTSSKDILTLTSYSQNLFEFKNTK